MDDCLSDLFDDSEFEFADTNIAGDELFSILESLESAVEFAPADSSCGEETPRSLPKTKKRKLVSSKEEKEAEEEHGGGGGGQQKVSHITVERNRRKQMNEHLTVLRSLMPCFYVKRGDQASIIGGVVEYINELQQVLQSLESKKQRKVYSEVLSSPRLSVSSPRPLLSPRKPPLSPRISLPPLSPRTPNSPYKQPPPPTTNRLLLQPNSPYLSPTTNTTITSNSLEIPSPSNSTNSSTNCVIDDQLVANSKSAVADVEVKFCGANLLLKTVSHRIPGQAVKIVSALQHLSLEILHVNINTVDDTMLNSFTIKIGIECQLSAEELAHQVQLTFC